MKVRVSAANEQLACIFVDRMLPYLEKAIGTPVVTAAICSEVAVKPLIDSIRSFVPIDSWCFSEASENFAKLANQGINLIVLSETFCEWETEGETIANNLESFESSLEAYGMTIIGIEKYDGTYAPMFDNPKQWQPISIESILSLMVEDYMDASLILPWGMLPYFIIEPVQPEELETLPSIKVMVGFQPQIYARINTEYLPEKFPFVHWLPDEYKSLKVGPLPFLCAICPG